MTTPIDLWRGRVEAGTLTADPDQERAARALTELSERLRSWKPGATSLVRKTEAGRRGASISGAGSGAANPC